MILRALYDLARQEGLAEDLDYQFAPVAFLIVLGGPVPRLIGRFDDPPDGKGKPKASPMRIPRPEIRTAGDKANFLVDKAEYVFGWDPIERQKPEKRANRQKLFRDRVVAARSGLVSSSQESRALAAVLSFLDSPLEVRVAPLIERLGPSPADAARKELAGALFAFAYGPAGPDPIHLLPGLQTYWRGLRASSGDGSNRITCLVTGDLGEAAKLHPPVKSVPGGNTGGAALVSFNAKAFESYGLEGNANAPIAKDTAETCGNALNRLLSQTPCKSTGERLSKLNLRLSEDTAALFWSTGDDAEADWLGASLLADDPEQVRVLLHSPWKGKAVPIEDGSRFHTLLLSGAQGRSIVRNFLEGTTRQVAANVLSYLEDTRIDRPYGKGIGGYPLPRLLKVLAPLGKTENLPPHLATELYLCALFGRSFPVSILEVAIRRNRAEGPDGESFAARCSLIRACLIRQSHPSRKEIPVSLDAERPEGAYHLGRLLATLDRCQGDAQGSVNATLVDRYYGAASSTPAAVFPTLLRNNRYHLAKLRKEKPGLAVNHERLLQEVIERLQQFPSTLALPDQGLFALGFHHQRQVFFTKKTVTESTQV